MLDKFTSNQWNDENGNPAGGCTCGVGFCISWQNGPLGRADDPGGRRVPNGAFVETIIAAVKGRLSFYQNSKFNCPENRRAIEYLDLALESLRDRTRHREERGVEGTHKV